MQMVDPKDKESNTGVMLLEPATQPNAGTDCRGPRIQIESPADLARLLSPIDFVWRHPGIAHQRLCDIPVVIQRLCQVD